jgi:hypothetical protein
MLQRFTSCTGPGAVITLLKLFTLNATAASLLEAGS